MGFVRPLLEKSSHHWAVFREDIRPETINIGGYPSARGSRIEAESWPGGSNYFYFSLVTKERLVVSGYRDVGRLIYTMNDNRTENYSEHEIINSSD